MAETHCDCRACQECCRHVPGALLRLADLERLEAATRREHEDELAWAKRMLVASAGAVIADTRTGRTTEVPTLALRSTATGACAQFDGQHCRIYDARPACCSDFDTHMTDEGAQAIGLPMHTERLTAFATDSEHRYGQLWAYLALRGHTRTRRSLSRRQARLARRIRSLENAAAARAEAHD